MSRKAFILFLPAIIVFLLQGCFNELAVSPYYVKQEKPVVSEKPAQVKPEKEAPKKIEGKPESRIEAPKTPSPAPKSAGERATMEPAPQAAKIDLTRAELEQLERKIENLSRKIDSQERRILKLEDEIRTSK